MSDEPTIVTVSVPIGPWRTRDGYPTIRAPHGRPEHGHVSLRSEWADDAHTILLAVHDEDGCRAEVRIEPVEP